MFQKYGFNDVLMSNYLIIFSN